MNNYNQYNQGNQNYRYQMPQSIFTGGLLGLIGHRLLTLIVTVITLGIAYPWAICHLLRWEMNHTYIEGRRLVFTGSALGLFGQWIKWLLLTLITLGIYGFWVNIKMKKWKVRHTHFA